MKLTASEIFKGHLIRYIIAGGFLPMVYIIFLLMFNYQNNLALQSSSKKRIQLDVEKHAKTLEYFFLERKYNIRSIADSMEVHTYFTNREMGMSEQYGLRVSLFSIGQSMVKMIKNSAIKEQPVYKQFALLDEKGNVLVTRTAFHEQAGKIKVGRLKKGSAGRDPQLMIEKTRQGYDLLLVTQCFFKQQVSGWVVAWLDLDAIYNFFLGSSLTMSSKVFCLTLKNGDIIGPASPVLQEFFKAGFKTKIAKTKNVNLVSVNSASGGPDSVLVARLQIQTFPLFLTVFIERNEILGHLRGWQFLAGTGAITLVVFLIVVLFAQTNTKHLILEARFEESEKQQARLVRKNKQLHKEILKRKDTERILKINEERYRKLFESSSDAILIVMDNHITDCNQKTAELLGIDHSRIIDQAFYSFSPDTQPDGSDSKQKGLEKLKQALVSPQFFEWTLNGLDDQFIEVEINMTALLLDSNRCIQVIVRDVTERNHSQEMMVQTEKMAAVGGLATGMAHEINNPLGIILMSAQNIHRRIGTRLKKNQETAHSIGLDFDRLQTYLREKSIFTYVEAIQSAGERAAKIVKSMLDFGRASSLMTREPCQLSALVDQAIEMASNDYDMKKKFDFKTIEIHRHYQAIAPVFCDKTEMTQVFLNIIKNAAQAMAAQPGEKMFPRLDIYIKEKNNRAVIVIADNGPGIKKENQKKIFQPFFTTKPVGDGTGLGLSVSYFIIATHHNGMLRVESKHGSGARFIIELKPHQVKKRGKNESSCFIG